MEKRAASKSAPDPARMPRMGLGRRTTLLAFLSTSALALVLAAIALYSTYTLARQQTDDTHRVALAWSAERLVSWLGWTQSGLEELSRVEALAQRGSGEPAPEPDASRHLKAGLLHLPVFEGLILLDLEGVPYAWAGDAAALHVLLADLPVPEPGDVELGEVMRRAELRRKFTAHTEPALQALDLGGATASLVASTPLHDARGRALGSLHGLLRHEDVALQLRADLLRGDGRIYLLAGDGAVICAGGSAGSEAVEPPLHDGRLRGDAESALFSWSADSGWAASSSRAAGVHDWNLVVQQSARSALGSVVREIPILLIPAALLILLCTSLGSLIGARMNRPFAAVYAATRRIEKGDFDAQLPAQRASGGFGALFNAFNTMASQLREERERYHKQLRALTEQNQVFQKKHDVLARLSITDGLTELNNHRFFQDQLGREIKRLSRGGQGLSMLLIDIDDFKQLNDRFGHAAGDEFLKQLAQILKESVRETDLLARYGGEEFVIVATNTDPEGAVTLAQKLCTTIAESTFIVDATMRPRRMTISIGVAAFRRSRTELFASADAALYRAKTAGKNCVVAADEVAEPA
jgi:diguanylate cyclase (GGDEF)-like protein